VPKREHRQRVHARRRRHRKAGIKQKLGIDAAVERSRQAKRILDDTEEWADQLDYDTTEETD